MKKALCLFFALGLFAACDDSGTSADNASKENLQDDETSVSTGFMTDSRDGQTYKTVKIGSQTWMAQNLNYETDSSFCYNDMENNCAKYGRLYTWSAAMSACPSGWHLPDTTEWKTLSNAVGGDSAAGHVLMSISGWSNGNGTDAFGFSALPAGGWSPAFPFFGEEARYADEGEVAVFWSSTESDYWAGEDDNDGVYSISIFFSGYQKNFASWGLGENGKEDAYRRSVRCLKD